MSKRSTRRELLAFAGTAAVAVAGCVGGNDDDDGSSGNGGTDNGGEMNDDEEMDDGEDMGDEEMENGEDTGNGEEMDDGSEGSMERPEWQTATLEDVTTGETFSIASFDRPVILHTFATWCPKCRSQQENIDAYLSEAGGSAVAIDLTIDENDDPDMLRDHAESNGFDWRFGVSPSEVTGQLVDEFGREMASAPQSPVVIVCPDGQSQTISKGAGPDTLADEIETTCG